MIKRKRHKYAGDLIARLEGRPDHTAVCTALVEISGEPSSSAFIDALVEKCHSGKDRMFREGTTIDKVTFSMSLIDNIPAMRVRDAWGGTPLIYTVINIRKA